MRTTLLLTIVLVLTSAVFGLFGRKTAPKPVCCCFDASGNQKKFVDGKGTEKELMRQGSPCAEISSGFGNSAKRFFSGGSKGGDKCEGVKLSSNTNDACDKSLFDKHKSAIESLKKETGVSYICCNGKSAQSMSGNGLKNVYVTKSKDLVCNYDKLVVKSISGTNEGAAKNVCKDVSIQRDIMAAAAATEASASEGASGSDSSQSGSQTQQQSSDSQEE